MKSVENNDKQVSNKPESNSNNNKSNNKLFYGIIAAILLIFVVVITIFAVKGCKADGSDIAMDYKDPNGNVTATVDRSFLCLMVAMSNHENGTATITDKTLWDQAIPGTEITYRDVIRADATAKVEALLKAEYLHDCVYNIDFNDEQKKSVEDTIKVITNKFGSKKDLEAELSKYETDIESLERFIVLYLKEQTLNQTLYSEGSILEITDADVKNFFSENYCIADYIYINLTGGQKDTGEYIPLDDEAYAEKKEKATTAYNQVISGAMDFKAAMAEYSEADYSNVFPEGYFVPYNGTAQGLHSDVASKVQAMAVDSIEMMETKQPEGIYIVKKYPMNAELYKTKEGFGDNLRYALKYDDYLKQLETADGVEIYEDVINSIDPSVIPAFNIDTYLG